MLEPDALSEYALPPESANVHSEVQSLSSPDALHWKQGVIYSFIYSFIIYLSSDYISSYLVVLNMVLVCKQGSFQMLASAWGVLLGVLVRTTLKTLLKPLHGGSGH